MSKDQDISHDVMKKWIKSKGEIARIMDAAALNRFLFFMTI